MSRTRTNAILTVALPGLLAGCAAQTGAGAGGDVVELRRQLLETRRELEEVRRDQERLRNSVEYLQYGQGGSAPAAYGAAANRNSPPSGWPQDSWGSNQQMGSASAYDAMSAAPQPMGAAMDSQSPTPAVPGEFIYNDPRNPERAQPGELDSGDSRIVAGVRGGGSWTEPGQTGVHTPAPTVPSKLRGSGYDDGVRAFNESHYDDAIQYFRDFIHKNPQSDHADDAQFWIGECYLRKGMHSNAIKEFNQVVLRYSSGDRSAAALLKLAEVFSQIGDQVDARLSLQKLVNRYPGSSEAAEAYRLLQEMGS